MEKRPYCVPKLSLSDIASRRVIVNLWNESDILSSIADIQINSTNYIRSRNAFQAAVDGKVKDKLSNLVLPEVLKKQMANLVKPIGSEIRGWKRYHEKYLSDSREDLDVSILEQLCWTSSGMIEYKKTAEKLIHCGMLDVEKRYKLACLYCLEDYIPVVWEELPEEIKSTFYNKEDASHIKQPSLQYFWPYILKGEENVLDNIPGRITMRNLTTFHQYVFENSARSGNKAATEYFFRKLTHVEKEGSLIRTAHFVVLTRNLELYENADNLQMEKHSEVLCYLLSLMTPEQQMEVIKKQPPLFLRCFLDWPWHDNFLEMASLIWTFLPESDYEILLWSMSHAIIRSGDFIPKLFHGFFIQSPIDFKKHFLHQACQFGDFFTIFFDNQDSETIQVIFRNVDVDDRVKLVSSYKFFNIVDDLIMGDRWQFVELCLREATLSKEDKERLKKTFMSFLTDDDKLPLKPKEWKRFFQLLDEIDANAPNKRSSEDETLTKAKKLCPSE